MDSSIPIPSLIGQTVGNWHLLRQLGAGSFGAVYEAQHQAISERRAAVKVLHPHLSTDAVVQRRFINEANAASKIEHQNIIQIYDGGVTDSGVCYVVMELISGHSLETILEKGRLTPARAVQLTAQIASALGAAHAAGIVHRGCTPASRRRFGLFRVGRKRHESSQEYGKKSRQGPRIARAARDP
jgi:serine/threonine-protein kinase